MTVLEGAVTSIRTNHNVEESTELFLQSGYGVLSTCFLLVVVTGAVFKFMATGCKRWYEAMERRRPR